MGKEILFNIRINVQQEKELDRLKKRMDYLINKQKQHKNLTKAETVELKAVRKEYNALNTSLARQAGLQTTQANTLGRVNAQLAIERQRIKEVVIGSRDFKLIAARIKDLENKQRQYNAAIGRGKTFVGEYARGVITAFQKMAAGIMTAVIAFRSLSRLFKSTIDTLAEFERGQTNVQTLLEDFDDQLRDESIELVRKYALAHKDMNRALFDTVSAGVSVRDAIDFMTESAILAIAGVSDMESVVDGMTTVMNVWNLQMDEMNRVSAAFFSAQKKGKFYVADITAEIGRVASIAKVANMSYQELMSTYAELTKRGLPLEESTTAIKAAILAITKPSEKAKKVFEDLEIQTGLNAVANQGLFAILTKINSATQEDKDLLTELVPNVRALTGVTILNEEALRDYDEILKIVNEDFGEGSSMIKAYYLQLETLEFKQKKLKSTWDALILSVKTTQELSEIYGGTLEGLAWIIGKLNDEMIEEESWLNKIKKHIKLVLIDSTNLGRAIHYLVKGLKLLNKTSEETNEIYEETKWMSKEAIQAIVNRIDKEKELEKLEKAKLEREKALDEAKRLNEINETFASQLENIGKTGEKWKETKTIRQNYIDSLIAGMDKEEEKLAEHEDKLFQLELDHTNKSIKNAETKAKLQKEAADLTLVVWSDMFASIGLLFDENTIAYKAGLIAQTTMDTYASAVKAYKSVVGIPFVGPALAPVAAAAAIAFGLGQVRKIIALASGGIIPGYGDKDTIPVMATPGEGIINKRSMASQDVMTLTGRPFDIASQINSYKGFGIPFAAGGIVPGNTYNTYNQLDKSAINEIINAINTREIKVYQNVNEVIEAQAEIKVKQQTSEL